ncbi:MAG TPA: class I SAM-dependent methyltransferase [Mycobacteriales bacterium]|nr:class I SAM-dependent methyltransferase [Mycobacteriales bacterium]
MLDYDAEAPTYDGKRGGTARAAAAADALSGLLRSGPVLDVAGGTGIVGEQLRQRGVPILVADRSAGMLAKAAGRLPGCVVQADGARIPFGDGVLGGVVMIWLLHLVPDVRPFIAEAARSLRVGGVLLTTVDKAAAHGWGQPGEGPDAPARVASIAIEHGLSECGRTRFTGHGMGRDGNADPVFDVRSFERVR